MNVNEFIEKLSRLNEGLRKKEIYIVAENGLLFPPSIIFDLEDIYMPFDISDENVKRVILN